MRTSIAFASILSFASVALGQGCAEASRFGNSVVTASSSKALVAGDTLKVTTNYTCALQFGIKPTFTDYTIDVEQNNNGHEPEIFLLRVDNPPTISTVTLKIPAGYYFPNASYSLFVDLTYPINGTDGTPVYVRGGQLEGLNIAPTV